MIRYIQLFVSSSLPAFVFFGEPPDLVADTANGNDTILISKYDKLYRPPYARSPNTTEYDSYTPYFICSIINTDPQVAASYRLEADLIVNNATLSLPEQRALANIYDA
jgi:hypothetical protein